MNHSIDLTIVRKYLRTRDDANDFQMILEHLLNNLFTAGIDIEQLLLKNSSYQKTTLLKQLAKSGNLNLQDKTQMQLFLGEIKTFIAKLPVVTLTVAIEPKETMITAIHDWFYRNYKVIVLLDLKIDSSLIGGTIVRFNGRYQDYSLKKALDEMETKGLN